MTTITIDDTAYEIRALTRGEMKALRKEGLLVTQIGEDRVAADAAIDATLLLMFDAAAIDAMPNPVANRLFMAIVSATYGSADAEKNSSGSGSGTPTRSGSDTAAPAATPTP